MLYVIVQAPQYSGTDSALSYKVMFEKNINHFKKVNITQGRVG